MSVNPKKNRRAAAAFWLTLLLSANLAIALGQTSNNLQQAANQNDPRIPATSAAPADLGSTFSPMPISSEYKIGIDDVLTINVWHEPDLSRNLTVRPDGKITLPLVGDVRAAGKTPPQLEAELRSDLAQYIKDPELTVIVADIRSRRVNIIGQVTHPGTFALTQQMGVLDVIAEAGGLRDFAKRNKIYVLRETSAGVRVRLKYDYRDVLAAKNDAKDILLQANDTVVVP
jgi:polysaccharide export outer membrane protein